MTEKNRKNSEEPGRREEMENQGERLESCRNDQKRLRTTKSWARLGKVEETRKAWGPEEGTASTATAAQ
ncbi:hypothetical protein [Streptomyces sp. NPDC014995]|uniref:hypothetical protein n=1 Tax=Streptomyces sp. NPDC014995 TaxID=3364936 RepID=UPI0036FDE310